MLAIENPLQRIYTKEQFQNNQIKEGEEDEQFLYEKCAFKCNKLVELLLDKNMVTPHIMVDQEMMY